jgi:Tol biopolymer transport system component
VSSLVKVALAVLAMLLAIAAVPAVRHLRERPPAPPPPVRLSLAAPSGAEPGWGDEPLDAAIAPDESTLAFVATTGGVRQLWLRALDEAEATPLSGTEGAQLPAWKQTGRVIAFFADGRLKQVTFPDLQVHTLADVPVPLGATWLADGSLVVASGSGPLQRLHSGGTSTATTMAAGDRAHAFPVAVPGTGDFVYTAVRDDGRRVARLVAGGEEQDLTQTSGHAALVGNRLLHVRDGVLLSYERDPDTGALAPRGTVLGLGVGVSSAGRALFTASPRVLLHAPLAPRPHALVWVDQAGARVGGVGDAGDYWQVRLSPDDRLAAVTMRDPQLHGLDIMLFPTASAGQARKLTPALAADTDPVWSPDGLRVLFRSLGGGRPDLFARRVDGGTADADEPVLRSDLDETATAWTGTRILFHARQTTSADVFALDAASGAFTALLDGPFAETDARVSPDGRWVAFVSDESGRADVYARTNDGGRVRVSFAGGSRPRWTAGGDALLFVRGSQVMRAAREGDGFAAARALFEAPGLRDFDTAHRSDRLLAILPAGGGDPPVVSAVVSW